MTDRVQIGFGVLRDVERLDVSRTVPVRLPSLSEQNQRETIMLIGPGRFGTKMPELGVPVSFSEIDKVSVLCEIDAIHEGLTPDLSLGTHFFHELVEMNMLYLGLFHKREPNFLNSAWLDESPNLLTQLLPDEAALSQVVRLIDPPNGQELMLHADHLEQKAILYLKH